MARGASSASRMRQQGKASRYGDRDIQQYERTQLNKKLQTLKASLRELGDYEPRVYAEEGNSQRNFRLDAISIPEDSFDPDLDLDYKFRNLASICMPTNSMNYSTEA